MAVVTRIRAIRRACLKEHARFRIETIEVPLGRRSCHSFVIVPNVLTGLGLRRATTPAKRDPLAGRPVLGASPRSKRANSSAADRAPSASSEAAASNLQQVSSPCSSSSMRIHPRWLRLVVGRVAPCL